MKSFQFVKWPKIGQFHNVRKTVKKLELYQKSKNLDPYRPPVISYRGKVKLDGTNAAIAVTSDGVYAQSRSKTITPQDDNMGFAKWLFDSGYSELLLERSRGYTIFGEWCGQGIQKGAAITRIGKKIFAVFAIVFHKDPDDPDFSESDLKDEVRYCPDYISRVIPSHDDVHIIDWEFPIITIDYGSELSIESAVNTMNAEVDRVETCDPFVKSEFGIEGVGEGVVYYPLESDISVFKYSGSREYLSTWAFKAKGEKHRVVKQKAPVVSDPEKIASQEAFVAKFVTPNRLEQGLREIGGEMDMKHIGNFLKWFGQDVKLESVDELETSGMEWKDVSKAVVAAARKWWLEECKKV